MIPQPYLLVPAAVKAGIEVPNDIHNFEPEEYPHFAVFVNAQTNKLLPHAEAHFDNAKLVAQIPREVVLQMSLKDLVNRGFQIGEKSC